MMQKIYILGLLNIMLCSAQFKNELDLDCDQDFNSNDHAYYLGLFSIVGCSEFQQQTEQMMRTEGA